jgi:predicted nucleotidyltransferase component of viral defense system
LIPQRFITTWAANAPWPTNEQVEQDLLLSRLIVEIANDEYLGNELVFRGGTCLHKLRLVPGLRYSEDLDYVRQSAGGIGEMTTSLRDIGERLGMKVNVEISKYPKVKFRAPFESGRGSMRIKIEVNTYERSPAHALERVPYSVESRWFTGSADVLTFSLAELVATKIRALYQRSKGRDLFDMWAALTILGLQPEEILSAFGPYRPDGLTSSLAIANLGAKLAKPDFRDDLENLTRRPPNGYIIESAAQLVATEVLALLD